MISSRLHPIFATPLVIHEIEDAEEINAALVQRILSKRDEDVGLKLSNRSGWQSKHDLHEWAGPEGEKIIERAGQLATKHVQRADGQSPRWRIESWANVNDAGGFNMPHVHGGTYWSAVYYVRARGGGGQLVLHDPRMPALRMHAPGLRFLNVGPELKVELTPKEGMLLLFPGWLSHSVEPHDGAAGERISIAMNVRAIN